MKNVHNRSMVTILHSLEPLAHSAFAVAGGQGSYAVVTLAAVRVDRMFILAFAPTLGAIAAILGWRVWQHWKKSQQ